jgi:hypothetical protein
MLEHSQTKLQRLNMTKSLKLSSTKLNCEHMDNSKLLLKSLAQEARSRLTPKDLHVFLAKIASNQPLLKTR